MIYLNILKSEISRNLKEFISYKVGFLSDIAVTSILYFSLLFLNSGSSLGRYYGGNTNSKALLLLGYIFWEFSISSINTVSNELGMEAVKGTLEQKFMAIVPFFFLLSGSALAGIIIQIMEASIIIILSIIIGKVGLIINFSVIIALILTLIGMYGMGLILGGIAIKEKKIGNLVFILQILLLFLTDTITKTNLPSIISKSIPLTQGIDIARKSVTGISITSGDWLALTITSFIWLLIGAIIFNVFTNIARENGLLGNY